MSEETRERIQRTTTITTHDGAAYRWRVILFVGADGWAAQGVEVNVAAQGATREQALANLRRQIEAEHRLAARHGATLLEQAPGLPEHAALYAWE